MQVDAHGSDFFYVSRFLSGLSSFWASEEMGEGCEGAVTVTNFPELPTVVLSGGVVRNAAMGIAMLDHSNLRYRSTPPGRDGSGGEEKERRLSTTVLNTEGRQ